MMIFFQCAEHILHTLVFLWGQFDPKLFELCKTCLSMCDLTKEYRMTRGETSLMFGGQPVEGARVALSPFWGDLRRPRTMDV